MDGARKVSTCGLSLVITVLCLVAGSLSAGEGKPGTAQWYPSMYGAEDTLGAINNLSPAKVLQAAALVREGKTYALGVETNTSTPAFPPRFFHLSVVQPGDGTGRPLGDNLATGNDDRMSAWVGVGSQIDGLGHMGENHVYYNGHRAEDIVTPTGLKKLGIHALPPIVTRGVLLDMAAWFKMERLPAGRIFDREDIVAAAKARDITITKGDVVLFHTGWQSLAESNPEEFIAGEPGIGVDGARYLASLGVVAIGADTWGLEAVPHRVPGRFFPVHVELLAHNGVYILENMNTGPLVKDGVREFMFVLGQPRFTGAVQAVINPVAIR